MDRCSSPRAIVMWELALVFPRDEFHSVRQEARILSTSNGPRSWCSNLLGWWAVAMRSAQLAIDAWGRKRIRTVTRIRDRGRRSSGVTRKHIRAGKANDCVLDVGDAPLQVYQIKGYGVSDGPKCFRTSTLTIKADADLVLERVDLVVECLDQANNLVHLRLIHGAGVLIELF